MKRRIAKSFVFHKLLAKTYMKSVNENLEDYETSIFEYFIWFISYIEGCCIGFMASKEEKYKKKHPRHNFVQDVQQGCEAGCMEGAWLGGE